MHGTERVYERYRTAGFADSDPAAVAEGYAYLLQRLPPPDRPILDLGCGGGEFLDFLVRQGYTAAAGIDHSDEQVERCVTRGLARVSRVTDAHEFLRQHPGGFECVVMNDVLEHIPKNDCLALLEDIRGALRPGGRCLVKVPNAANVFGLVARYLDFTHEIAFTETSLRQVLVAAGYSDVEVTGLPLPLRLRPKRVLYWTANRLYMTLHRAAYVAAVGSDAPTILTKLLVASGRR
jgi:2-polyprenyl-3-methyl-5-hydroxy-6-metoxy-1,4-benzoquinol methylase